MLLLEYVLYHCKTENSKNNSISDGRLLTPVCHWMLTSTFIGHQHVRHVPSAVTQNMSAAGPHVWNSLLTRLRESDITLGQFP